MKRPPQLNAENAARFQDLSVVDRYHLRLPYPAGTFDLLRDLMVERHGAILDVGTGIGVLARPLAPTVDRVDALDPSAAMIAHGKTLPGGNHPNLHWIHGSAEDAPLNPPYGLIIGGDSLHWTNWEIVFPRFREALAVGGVVAVLSRSEVDLPWQEDLTRLIPQYSTIKDFVKRDFQRQILGEDLMQQGLFQPLGERLIGPEDHRQSVDDYIASWHSRSSFSVEAMPPQDAKAFDEALRVLVTAYAEDGMLTLRTRAWVTWGLPAPN